MFLDSAQLCKTQEILTGMIKLSARPSSWLLSSVSCLPHPWGSFLLAPDFTWSAHTWDHVPFYLLSNSFFYPCLIFFLTLLKIWHTLYLSIYIHTYMYLNSLSTKMPGPWRHGSLLHPGRLEQVRQMNSLSLPSALLHSSETQVWLDHIAASTLPVGSHSGTRPNSLARHWQGCKGGCSPWCTSPILSVQYCGSVLYPPKICSHLSASLCSLLFSTKGPLQGTLP